MNPDDKVNSDSSGRLLKGLDPRDLIACGMETLSEGVPKPSAEVPSAEKLKDSFPGLEVLELIGRGGMGVVYKARQIELHREVALKLLAGSGTSKSEFSLRFRREARAMARLRHPCIVDIFDFGQTASGVPYIVMEYVAGSNLQDVIQSKTLSPRAALAIVPQICDALQYAHDRGIVHRDIKPANILLSEEGEIKVSDFGIAKLAEMKGPQDPSLTATDQVVGTPFYMAPEQLEGGGHIDHRADIYSLGVMFYEMLTGELPRGAFRQPSDINSDVDHRLDKIVNRSLQTDPARRYQKASEVKTAVQEASSLHRKGSGSRPRRHWIGGLAAAAVVILALVWPRLPDGDKAGGQSSESDSPTELQEAAAVSPPSADGPMTVLFHCSLDDEESIRNPLTGSGGQLIGDSGFVEGKEGHARLFTRKGGDRLVFPTVSADGIPNISLDRGEVEFWYRPEYDYGDSIEYGSCTLFVLGDAYKVPRLHLAHLDFLQFSHNYMGEDGEWKTLILGCSPSASTPLWTAGDWVHFRLYWDASHPTDSLRLFVDGKRAGESVIAGGWSMETYAQVPVFSVGSTGQGVGEESAHGAFDELIIRGRARSP